MSLDMEQLRQVFVDECNENLDVIEQELLKLGERSPDSEEINTIFRAAHSIKGGGATFGFTQISEFTHLLETLLDEIRAGVRQYQGEFADLLLQSGDQIRLMVAPDFVTGSNDKTLSELKERFNHYLATKCNGDSPAELSSSEQEQTDSDWRVLFSPDDDILFSGNDPVRILTELHSLGEVDANCITENLPDFAQLDPEKLYLRWEMRCEPAIEREKISGCFDWVEDQCELVIERLKPDAVTESAEQTTVDDSAPKNVSSSAKTSGSIRVEINKVDALINLVGELVITQSMLNELGNNFSPDNIERLKSGLDQLLHNTKALQQSVLEIRMLPISNAFNRVPRLVRDIAKQLDKKVNLHISGEQTELDKTVMEQIVDPLIHLIRNAVDHGIETPDVRVNKGKDQAGNVFLDAYQQGENIIIEIRDDGAGLNADKLKISAVQKGIITEESAAHLSEQELYDLIFAPGFSTAAQVSDLSGRGVGMDVVKRNISQLGGQISLSSEPGNGTQIRINLPLTLAIVDGQLVRVGDQIFVIPLVAIIESTQIDPEMLTTVGGGTELYRLREENIPIIRLGTEFGIQTSPYKELGLLCVVEAADQKVGILVDELLAQQQVVIKSLESNYQSVPGISGATILGDGSVSLIIDVPGLSDNVLTTAAVKDSSVAA
ncbi:chemotaxis protein CheA [Ferrimonas aestuarii]|uniref:Chemotaxis protein CheA n=1 Tax=Ferrimonas aestuarii TaxID=2569539 RepID=A0A4V5NWQ2_9GAMM|nr:chemotaxis protein CheA [Ferrimonas aestuarii]TKB57462.1 chemotaxis protein CheA [Ferrimonas aestuarii]